MRFVRLLQPDPTIPVRIRVDYDPDYSGRMILSEEETLPERVYNPNAFNVKEYECIDMTPEIVDFLIEALTELRKEINK